MEELFKWFYGGLNESEWKELVALEYVFTWNYTTDHEKDEARYKELSDRNWAYRLNNQFNPVA